MNLMQIKSHIPFKLQVMQMLHSVQLLGDASGSAGIFFITAEGGLQNSKSEASRKAVAAGGTHIVWRAAQDQYPFKVIGRVYNCTQAQKALQASANSSNDLLNQEYARLLNEANQGSITYAAAFKQLDGLRSRLYSDDPYLAEYFRYMSEVSLKLDAKEMTLDDATKFLEQRLQLLAQKARQDRQQKDNERVASQLREDQSIQSQADANAEANRANGTALMGLGLGVMNMRNVQQYNASPSPPTVCQWRQYAGGWTQICQ